MRVGERVAGKKDRVGRSGEVREGSWGGCNHGHYIQV